MASLTNYGQDVCLLNDINGANTGTGGLAQVGKYLKLYTSASTPAKDGTGFTEEADGNGYTRPGKTVSSSNWTLSLSSGNKQVQLADQVWTADGGPISNIGGVYLTDVNGKVLAWWDRSTPVTINDGDSLAADNLVIRLV